VKIQFTLPEMERGQLIRRNGIAVGTIEDIQMTESGSVLVTAEITDPEMQEAIGGSYEYFSIEEESDGE
jgi:hypothetical protein